MAEDIRVGVFVCDCGSNIAGVINVPEVVEYAKGLPGVAFADEGRWSCSVDYLNRLKDFIRDHRLNRVVIASCTPRTHEPLFKQTVKEAGLNPYLLEFVSIREQSSWVHMGEPEKATEKAKDLIRMGVAKSVLLEEGEEIRLPVGSQCLIIGGGLAGLTASLQIADQDFQVFLVEKEPRLGGLLNRISRISHGRHSLPAGEFLRELATKVLEHPRIRVFTAAEIESLEGYVGNYKAAIRFDGLTEHLEVSTVIVATGMKEIEPLGLYDYGFDPRVITQLQLEERIREGWPEDRKNIVIINCINSKNESRGCCNLGCPVSVKNALALKERDPEARIHILYRDLSLVKEEHFALDAAKAAGIKFIRFPDARYPELIRENGNLRIKVYDLLLGRDLLLPCDQLVLTTGYRGDESVDRIKGLLKVSANRDGFFQERHVKLGPLDFPADGIALCGCAKSPKPLKDTLEEGLGAAMRVSIPMRRGYIEAEGIVAEIDLSLCNHCGICWKRCPYNAIKVTGDKEPLVIKALCKGCGLCAADCPQACVTIVHYSDAQLLAQVEAALAEKPDEKILGFVCHWCALGGVDMAGVSRLQYPAHGRLIRVMCSARVPIRLIERAFELGAAGVLVAGCEFPTCHYISGNYACETRVKRAKGLLAKKGVDPNRLWNVWCSAADGPKFAHTMREMTKQLGLT